MKKYKALTNLFRDFDEGDVMIFSTSFNRYWKQNACLTDMTLPVELVENYPEYFEEIKEDAVSTRDVLEYILKHADDVQDWKIETYNTILDKQIIKGYFSISQ